MSMRYTHLLIPHASDLVPSVETVSAYFKRLVEAEVAPTSASFTFGVPGPPRHGKNPMTGETIAIPGRKFTAINAMADLQITLAGADDYDAILSGMGPPSLAPFSIIALSAPDVELKEPYSYEIRFVLRPQPHPMSGAAFYDPASAPEGKNAIYMHPFSGRTVELPGVARARFWIELHLGNWLLPKMGDGLDCLDPRLLAIATDSFGIRFAQGCLWG